jgi:hypothetical protein
MNHCNAECVMCPRDTLSRKRGFMDFGLFEKVIKEISSVRRKRVTHLHGFVELLLDFKATFQNMNEFLRIRKELKSETPRLILRYLPDETNNAKTAEFESLWTPLIDPQKEIVSVCYSPWTSMSVLWDGRVVTCCMDSNGVQVLGDLNSQSVQEVWNGPALSGLRNSFRKLDYSTFPVCLSGDWVRRR